MSILSAENISKSYTEKILFDNISFTIEDNQTIALVGINGTGKSTLLKIIAGFEEPAKGQMTHMRNMQLQYLPQNMEYNEDATVLEHIFSGNHPSMTILKEYELLLEALKESPDDSKLQERLFAVTAQMDAKDLWTAESDAKSILSKLGITQYTLPMGVLSGGQKRRVFLAATLIHPSDLLVLDEPTNHLDNEMIQFLEDYLRRRKGATMMITHDRYFLDRITNRIFELYKGNLYVYEGNYTEFLTQKAEREAMVEHIEHKKQQLYKHELEWIRAGAKARSTKQKARIQRFEQLDQQRTDTSKQSLDISVGTRRIGKKIIELENIVKAYNNNPVVRDFSYIVQREDRIGIVGKNGSGKTTLLNIISERVKPDAGQVEVGETIQIGYFTQESIDMDMNLRVIDYIKETAEIVYTADGRGITAGQMLERFLFPPDLQYAVIQKLSGGERKRLYLLKILMETPNVLLLDEPTNDLDIETLGILEQYIGEFNGPVITVSHDRYFLDKIATKIFALQDNGEIKEYYGNYTDYYETVKDQPEQSEVAELQTAKNKTEKPKSNTVRFTYNEQKEYETIDEIVANLEGNIIELEEEINHAGSDFVLLQELMEEKEALEEKLNAAMERWVYLNEITEEIQRNKNGKQ